MFLRFQCAGIQLIHAQGFGRSSDVHLNFHERVRFIFAGEHLGKGECPARSTDEAMIVWFEATGWHVIIIARELLHISWFSHVAQGILDVDGLAFLGRIHCVIDFACRV